MAYLKNWTDNLFQIFFMRTSWVAVSINNKTTRASREMTSRKNIKIFYFNGVNVAKHWYVAGEVFAISDCLVEHEMHWQMNVVSLVTSKVTQITILDDCESRAHVWAECIHARIFHVYLLGKSLLFFMPSYTIGGGGGVMGGPQISNP